MKAKLSHYSIKQGKKSMAADPSALMQTERDFKDALLTVSIFANLFVLCVWVALQATTRYDEALLGFFLDR